VAHHSRHSSSRHGHHTARHVAEHRQHRGAHRMVASNHAASGHRHSAGKHRYASLRHDHHAKIRHLARETTTHSRSAACGGWGGNDRPCPRSLRGGHRAALRSAALRHAAAHRAS
jgi:hypothetical protein